MEKVVFIDRDGVINKEKEDGYVTKPKDFEFIPKALKALKLLSDSPYKIIIVTNQSGIAKGLYTIEDMHKVHDFMFKECKKKGITVDELFYCPHYNQDCECRKPGIGMFKQAAKKFNISFKESWAIGDKTSDIKAGKDAGCKTILVMTGHGGNDKRCDAEPDFKAKDLYEAVTLIILKN